MVGVWLISVSAWVFFADPAGVVGVEAAEELAKATGVCETVRALPVGVCEQSMERPLSGLQGRADMKGLGGEKGKAGVGWTDGLTPVGCLFLWRAGEAVRRCSSHNILGCVSLILDRCTPCVHLDMRNKSRIVLVVMY